MYFAKLRVPGESPRHHGWLRTCCARSEDWGQTEKKNRFSRDFRETLKATIYTYLLTVVDGLKNTYIKTHIIYNTYDYVRVHARTLKSVKAAKPPCNAQAAKPQSRKAAKPPWNAQAAKPQSRKAAKLPWNAQAAKPQSRKPQSRRAASSATHAPPPAFIAAALPPPWIAEAAKPQSRKL